MPDNMTKMEDKQPEKPFLNTAEAAAWLRLTKNTLEKMRVQGRGPVYRKHGRYVRYHIEDLVEFSQASKRRSTSDAD
ncbi:helix-turn-helix domain-containing protein [Bradyrhizobium brasilense]|uniref:helix-turn-helix domain-containing protein n=1 Tax=Bradyrhizobium brasilense TaxID=1419277 RepID=UPI0030B88CB0